METTENKQMIAADLTTISLHKGKVKPDWFYWGNY